MLVETYEVNEVTSDGVECEAEALELIESLGLSGQQSLVVRDQDGSEKRIPYRKMTGEEKFVYSRLCPEKTKLESYKDAMIPLRVLQVAAHAKSMFDHLYVWHPANADEKDPVLVGVNGDTYSPREFYILARWGEVLDSLEVLMPKALARARDKYAGKLHEIKVELEAALASVGNLSMSELMKREEPCFIK